MAGFPKLTAVGAAAGEAAVSRGNFGGILVIFFPDLLEHDDACGGYPPSN